MNREQGTTMALCLRCIVALEECGYEAEPVSEGMIRCDNCGQRCWGRTVRMHKSKKEDSRV